jgi:HEAT repeat protein
MIKTECPNVLGVLSGCWGPRLELRDQPTIPRYPQYVRWAVGPFWNQDAGTERPPNFKEEPIPGITNWECLLDADPPDSLDDALKRISAPAWRTWIAAREQLVATGLPAAPALLDAMSKADGEIRERIEGCLSRNARDARNGRRRGILELPKTLAFLRDKNETVRDMAAELAASCAEEAAAELRKNLKDQAAGASCARALGIVRDKASSKDLIQVLADPAMPVRARAEATRALGLLKDSESAGPLREALRGAKERDIRREALWALVLLAGAGTDKDVAALVNSEDEDIRLRAAMGLVALRSPELKQLVPWLSKDRNSMETAAMGMYLSWDWKELLAALQEAKKSQKDESLGKGLDPWIDYLNGVLKPK